MAWKESTLQAEMCGLIHQRLNLSGILVLISKEVTYSFTVISQILSCHNFVAGVSGSARGHGKYIKSWHRDVFNHGSRYTMGRSC